MQDILKEANQKLAAKRAGKSLGKGPDETGGLPSSAGAESTALVPVATRAEAQAAAGLAAALIYCAACGSSSKERLDY